MAREYKPPGLQPSIKALGKARQYFLDEMNVLKDAMSITVTYILKILLEVKRGMELHPSGANLLPSAFLCYKR